MQHCITGTITNSYGELIGIGRDPIASSSYGMAKGTRAQFRFGYQSTLADPEPGKSALTR
jgi:hypothetical protein